MAIRPVFRKNINPPHFEELNIDFTFFSGFSESQQQKSVTSLHRAYLEKYPESKILEVSTHSPSLLGKRLSAFNLKYRYDNEWYSVENIFQSSKCFSGGGPYRDILYVQPYEAKKDERLKESGSLLKFSFDGVDYPLEPKTLFYDWLFINALAQNRDLHEELLKYNAFTDIAFNPKKSINCQARTCAIFVSLVSTGLLNDALDSPSVFRELVYEFEMEPDPENVQMSIFEDFL